MGVSDAVRNPRSYVGDKRRFYRDALFAPGRFYGEHVGSRGLLREILLVAVVGIVGTAGTMFAVRTLREEYAGALTFDVEMLLWGEAFAPLVGAFLLWIGFALALYLVSWLYSTAGGLYGLLKNTAWSLLPLLVANLLLTVAFAFVTVTADFESADGVGAHPETRFEFMWEQLYHEPLVLGAYAVSIVFVAWCGYIAAPGVAEVRDLEMEEAYRVVAVPVVAYALYVAYTAGGALL